jgi:hypothetical protein
VGGHDHFRREAVRPLHVPARDVAGAPPACMPPSTWFDRGGQTEGQVSFLRGTDFASRPPEKRGFYLVKWRVRSKNSVKLED